MASSSSPIRAIMFAFSANFGIALAKTAAAVMTSSSSHRHLEMHADIFGILNVITFQMGPDVVLAAKIRMRPTLHARQVSQAINQLERALKSEFPEIKWCFIEPDVAD